MKLIMPSLATLLMAAVAIAMATTASAQPLTSSVKPLPSEALFQQLGGKPGLARLSDEFVERLWVDPRTGPFFKESGKKYLKTQIADQFCEVSGGPCRLDGPDMKKAHEALPIAKADFNALIEVLQAAMDAQGIPFGTQNRLLAQLAPMHRDIINRE